MNKFKIWYNTPVRSNAGVVNEYRSFVLDAWDYTMAADVFLQNYCNHVTEIVAVQSEKEFTDTAPVRRGPFKNSYHINATVCTGDTYCITIDADNKEDAIMTAFCFFKSRRMYGYISMQVIKKNVYKEGEAMKSTSTAPVVGNSADVDIASINAKSPLTEIVKLAMQNGSTLSILMNSHECIECSLVKLDEKEGTILVKRENTYSCIFLREVATINVKVSTN